MSNQVNQSKGVEESKLSYPLGKPNEGNYNNGVSELTNNGGYQEGLDSDSENLEKVLKILRETNPLIREKTTHISQLYGELIDSIPQKNKSEVTKKESKSLFTIPSLKVPSLPVPSLPVPSLKGFTDSVSPQLVKNVDTFLKDDKDYDLNRLIYPALKINEIIYDKMNSKTDKEKLESYIYYFFYILTKYIVKLILDDIRKKKINELNQLLKDNIAQLDSYMKTPFEFKDASIKSQYDALQKKFMEIYAFINKFPFEKMTGNKGMSEINKEHAKLLESISSFKFE